MLIDKTILAANIFAAESNIRPTLAGVYITPEKDFCATNSFMACCFKQTIKQIDADFPDVGIKDFEITSPVGMPTEMIKTLKFKKNKNLPILEKKVLWNYDGESIEFWETNLERQTRVKTRLLKWVMPDIKWFIPKDQDINVTFGLTLEYLEETLKALKLICEPHSHAQVRISLKAQPFDSLGGKLWTLDPVKIELYGQEDKGAAIIMPLKI